MKQIKLADYNKISNDYKGIFSDYQGLNPELKGKRTILEYDPKRGTCLIFEGIHFEII